MKKYILLIVFFLLFSISSCEDKTTSDNESDDEKQNGKINSFNPFDLLDEGENAIGVFSFGSNTRTLNFIGDDLEIEYELENLGEAIELGILIYIDGIIHKYYTEFDNNPKVLHSFDLEKKETKVFKIYIKPQVGKQGDVLILGSTTVFKPSYKASKNNLTREMEFSISGGAGNIPIAYDKNVDKTLDKKNKLKSTMIDMPYELKNELIENNSDITNSTKISIVNYNFIENDNCMVIDSKELVDIKIIMYGESYEYNVYFFANNEIVELENGINYITMDLRKKPENNVYSMAQIEINIPNSKFENYDIFYAVAVPIVKQESGATVETSEKFFVIRGEIE